MKIADQRQLELVDRDCPGCGADEGEPVARGLDWEYSSCGNQFTFRRCRRCRTVYLDPCPSPKDFNVIYPESYYTTAEAGPGGAVRLAWDAVERRRAAMFRQLLGSGDREVLDVGCGNGRLLRVLRAVGGGRWRLTGVERGLERAEIEGAAARGITLVDGLYEEVAFEPGRFDLIVAQQVIEHLFDPAAMLDKIRRELAPGGRVVIDTPNLEGVDRQMFSRRLWGGYHFPRHLTLFTPETLAALANRVGLEVVEVRPMLSPVFWLMTLHNAATTAGAPRAITGRISYRSPTLLALATALELPLLHLLGRTSNMRMVLCDPLTRER